MYPANPINKTIRMKLNILFSLVTFKKLFISFLRHSLVLLYKSLFGNDRILTQLTSQIPSSSLFRNQSPSFINVSRTRRTSLSLSKHTTKTSNSFHVFLLLGKVIPTRILKMSKQVGKVNNYVITRVKYRRVISSIATTSRKSILCAPSLSRLSVGVSRLAQIPTSVFSTTITWCRTYVPNFRYTRSGHNTQNPYQIVKTKDSQQPKLNASHYESFVLKFKHTFNLIQAYHA